MVAYLRDVSLENDNSSDKGDTTKLKTETQHSTCGSLTTLARPGPGESRRAALLHLLRIWNNFVCCCCSAFDATWLGNDRRTIESRSVSKANPHQTRTRQTSQLVGRRTNSPEPDYSPNTITFIPHPTFYSYFCFGSHFLICFFGGFLFFSILRARDCDVRLGWVRWWGLLSGQYFWIGLQGQTVLTWPNVSKHRIVMSFVRCTRKRAHARCCPLQLVVSLSWHYFVLQILL